MKLNLELLQNARKDNGYTQDDMTKLLGWKSRSMYAKRENGQVSIGADELIAIARILGYKKSEVGIFFK
ncbi:helix-turn-helix transcriptional regulator [Mammaliicoccus sciuri]|uniref:helix-turn-helix domain-containing protein n=1 Tax=Mammaliicoccus sciuri TaxID=1296 RepID=UPI0020A12E7A|nr:helix-turn-helix transcriptional regulator [Mammaliicoccus sciuri]MCP1286274.1 helix-turn-helix domain-containing protein [Mammaliicoccus sciuri]MDU0266366.1 helix-turn-helix transcriptional regulator [Mammaliicoccus sciuri]